MGYHCFFLIGFLTSCFYLKAQDLAAFVDYKNYFCIFDNGARTEAEYLPVKSFQVGGNTIAYIDNNENLRIYYKGAIATLSENTITKYTATDYLLTFSTFKVLDVFEGGKRTTLSNFASQYSTGDSLVAFYDERNMAYNIYYKGSVTLLESGSLNSPLQSFQMGDNIFAYVNYLNQFRLFYRGKTITLASSSLTLPYAAGKNIVAYVNPDYGFTLFHKWLIYNLETFQPKSFAVGDDLTAYVTSNDLFKVYYEGTSRVLCQYEPPFYKVTDSLLVYNEGERFKVFYRGTVYTLENYIPADYRIDFNTIAYLDQQGKLKIFQNGKTAFVTNSAVDNYELYRNVISYRILNRNYMYYHSTSYGQ